MLRISLWALTMIAAILSVGAVHVVEASNTTRTINSTRPSPNNPFDSFTIDSLPESFRRELIERSEMQGELDRRAVGGLVRVAAKLISKVVKKVKEDIEKDKKARGEFTKFVVNDGRRTAPQFNWAICHTKHRHKFKGVRGKDWDHEHKEFDVIIGGTIGYEVYYTREGEFWNNGDGGWNNWAIAGFFDADGEGNKHVMFKRPPGT
ncbi:hypothetical protein D9615_004667 [Tricholomella constricta]|uniref:Uncharacterized protein n=1 Tax=Tricholomella constricta TaxID=117010 RepID=A0A8H5M4J0_9AGAR|nr:hypothetical protein D9615_004667 [Tricholomella constricta]